MSRLSKLLDRLPIELFLIGLVVVSYWQVQRLRFVFDDAMYVFAARQTHHGLNLPAIQWALTSTQYANWHPLTWISYMVDSQVSGGMVSPRQLHLTNLVIHIAGMLMLFLLLNRLTKCVWKSAFVAALFAVHPLHVESVAWISERKDVLSTFFWVLTIWTYARFTEDRRVKTYLATMGCFILGLMSKPMIVTLPFTLLLLDYWPLGRLQTADDRQQTGDQGEQTTPDNAPSTMRQAASTNLRNLIWEKAPFFVLAAAASALTYYAQSHGGGFGRASGYPLSIRLMNALYSYVMYIWKMLWPVNLAVFYPHPGSHLAISKAAACGLFLIAVTVLVLRAGKKRPYLPFGWLWYLGTLVPVIGIIQVGQQGMADRYTYVPLIGLFVMIAWGVPDLFVKEPGIRSQESGAAQRSTLNSIIFPTTAVALILTLAVLTRIQVRYWRNNYTLFGHAIEVTKDNYEAHGNFGESLVSMGDNKGALREYEAALKITSDEADMHYNMGCALMNLGRFKEAEVVLKKALQLDPKYAPAHNSLGSLYTGQRRYNEAFEHLEMAVKLEPNYSDALVNLGDLRDAVGRHDEALATYDDALAADPGNSGAHYNRAVVLCEMGRMRESAEEYRQTIKLKPDYVSAHKNLAVVYFTLRQYEDAWKEVRLMQKYGGKIHPGFLAELSQRAPDPFEK